MTGSACPVCECTATEDVGGVGPVPVLCGSMWSTREEALASPSSELDLAVCYSCGHTWNTTFDASLMHYDAQYDNALDFSPTFRQYADELAHRLVSTFALRGKRVAEIGSGNGEFLRRLCAHGAGLGFGIDPTYQGPDRDGQVEFIGEFFSPDTVSRARPDFVCCRHVLEHVPDPVGFLSGVREAVGGSAPVPMYFEVPNAEFNFAESGPWDLIYPHVAYFSRPSLRALFARAGFQVLRLQESFHGQFIGADVVPAPTAPAHDPGLGDLGPALAPRFGSALRRQLATARTWRHRLPQLTAAGSVAIWGAGSKGATFLALVDQAGAVSAVVDANPRKWGRFLPGGGHEVRDPRSLAGGSFDSVIVMNPTYRQEIERDLASMDSAALTVAP